MNKAMFGFMLADVVVKNIYDNFLQKWIYKKGQQKLLMNLK